jgi:hypothetical protein
MLDGYGPEELRQVVRDLAEATAMVVGKASLTHAAAMRAIRTGAKADAEQFFLHLGRLNEADQIRIAQKRDSLLIERWTQAVFGSAEPADEYWSRWKE